VAVAVLLVAALVWGAVTIFKVRTSEGIVELVIDEPGAEVLVDGHQITVTVPGDNKPIEIKVVPGKRTLEIRKEGFVAVTREIEFKVGKMSPIQIALRPGKIAEVKPRSGEGFVSHFNGKDLKGWKVIGKPEAFEIKADHKAIAALPSNPVSRLETEKDYSDFHLRFDFRIMSASARSGVNIRMPPDATGILPALKVQVRDDSTPYGNSQTGGIYYHGGGWFKREREDLLKERGEWNHMEIIAQGKRVRVVVNGKQALDADLDKIDDPRAIPEARRLTGRIALNADLGEVWYRNIEIKDLSAKEEKPADKDWTSLFDGKTWAGWYVDSGPATAWDIVDGAIVCKGQGSSRRGWLLTRQSYTNFAFRCQYRQEDNSNGAIGIRCLEGEKEGTLPMHLAIKLHDRPVGNGDIQAGSIYYWPNTGQRPARSADLKPIGSWNDLEIELRGQQIRIVINGKEIQNFDLNELTRRDSYLPGVKRASGRIGLQQHTGEVRYRNIQIKELPAGK
jgi:hypothetical protein